MVHLGYRDAPVLAEGVEDPVFSVDGVGRLGDERSGRSRADDILLLVVAAQQIGRVPVGASVRKSGEKVGQKGVDACGPASRLSEAELVHGPFELEPLHLLLDVAAELLDVQFGAVAASERSAEASECAGGAARGEGGENAGRTGRQRTG